MFWTKQCTWVISLILMITTTTESYSSRLYFEGMKCSYGERGSLTATCTNVNVATFFKSTSYRFDHLDETLQCLSCSIKTIEPNSFDISGNQIKHLVLKDSNINQLDQRAFVGLVFLMDLDLSNNYIRTIQPGTFAGIKKIELVNLYNNSLESLKNDGFTELGNLKELILSYNQISKIEINAFKGLNSLQRLNLNHNKISNVSNIFNNLTSLEFLDLSDNNVDNLNGNDFNNLTSLLELKCDKNKLKKLPPLGFFGMFKLEFLGLSNNFIENIERTAFQGLFNLETLDLGNNSIVKIPEKTFQNLNSLVNLNLTGNKIEKFVISRFSGLPKLRILILSHNQITDIDMTGIFPLHDLHSLDLSYNNLTDLNYVVLLHRMPKISYLSLENNFWHCDLEDEMNNFFGDENFKFILYDNRNGSVECINETSRKAHDSKLPPEDVHHNAYVSETTYSSSPDIFMILSIIVLSVGVILLGYGQYRISQEIRFNPLLIRRSRTTSQVKLMQSEIRDEENDFIRGNN